MVPGSHSRRHLLQTAGATLGVVGLAGCLGEGGSVLSRLTGGSGEIETQPDGPQPQLAASQRYVHHGFDALAAAQLSGGVGVDGIPSIDEPQFESPTEATLDPEEPVFGVVRNGEAKAYPQFILVWHEIVNDTIGGDPVAVTYCPLTGTAQGFERGDTEFGVSGQLVNSNLVMYDRGTGTRWPQIIATGIDGPLTGESLAEFRVTWTSWRNWLDSHPETDVLTTDTGYQRRYGSDPYGSYAPPEEYYANDNLIFEPLESTTAEHPKEVVIGARTADGAIAFNKQRLLAEEMLQGEIGDDTLIAVAEPTLETGYVYRVDSATTVEPAGDGTVVVDGDSFAASSLPLESVLAFDAMFFAWYGFYPETTYVN